MTRPYLFIVNPNSGDPARRNALTITEYIEKKMRSLGQVAQVIVTERKGHATEITKTALKNRDWKALVAVGGDGTVNEIARNMLYSDAPLGIIPAGSGNGLARHLQIPMNIDSAMMRLIEGSQITIDSGRLNELPFFCTAGIGFDAVVSHEFAHSSERGLKNYVKHSLEAFREFKPVPVKIDDEYLSYFLMTFANAGQFGNNAWIAPKASTTDGKLDLCQITPFPDWYSMILATQLFSKTLSDSRYIQYSQFQQLSVETQTPVLAHVDGEPVTLESPFLKISCAPKSLTVIC